MTVCSSLFHVDFALFVHCAEYVKLHCIFLIFIFLFIQTLFYYLFLFFFNRFNVFLLIKTYINYEIVMVTFIYWFKNILDLLLLFIFLFNKESFEYHVQILTLLISNLETWLTCVTLELKFLRFIGNRLVLLDFFSWVIDIFERVDTLEFVYLALELFISLKLLYLIFLLKVHYPCHASFHIGIYYFLIYQTLHLF